MGFLDWMFPESQYSYVHVNDVPNYSEIKGGLVYDTAKSKLLSYKIWNFETAQLYAGLYKTKNGRFFKHQYNSLGSDIIVVSQREAMEIYEKYSTKKLVEPTEIYSELKEA